MPTQWKPKATKRQAYRKYSLARPVPLRRGGKGYQGKVIDQGISPVNQFIEGTVNPFLQRMSQHGPYVNTTAQNFLSQLQRMNLNPNNMWEAFRGTMANAPVPMPLPSGQEIYTGLNKAFTSKVKGFHPRGYHSAIVSQPGQANYSRVEGGQAQTQGVLENLIPGTEDLYYGGGVGGGGEYAYPASPFAAYRGGAAAQTQTITPERQTLRNVLSSPSQYGTAGTQFASRWNQLLTTWRL